MKKIIYLIGFLLFLWLLATFYAQLSGEQETVILPVSKSDMSAIVIYNPDPFYNLDEQVCMSLGKGLQREGIEATVMTTKNLYNLTKKYDLYIFCANTYNYAPDWLVSRAIKKMNLSNENTVAITLGAGSTDRAQRKVEDLLVKANARILGSKAIWWWKTNDERRRSESNILVANQMAEGFGVVMARKLRESLSNKRNKRNEYKKYKP